MKIRTLAATVVALALALTACSGGRDANQPQGQAATGAQLTDDGWALRTAPAQKGGTVTVLGNSELSYLDPVKGNDGNVNNFYRLIYRQLMTYKNDINEAGSTVVPDLATGPGKPNADATEWTYTLKDNIYYEDGTPITAKDFKYAVERSLDPQLRLGTDFLIQYIEGAEKYQGIYKDPNGLASVTAPDDKTIVFKLVRPVAGFDQVVAMNVLTPFPKDKVTSINQLDEKPISSGPYKVESYQRGSKLTLVRNDKWTADTDTERTALPDKFEFLFGMDANTIDQRMISAMGPDQNAVASSTNPLQASSLPNVENQAAIKARTVKDQPNCTTYLGMNMTKKPLDDLKVRQAISYAINKQQVQTATGGPQLAQFASEMLLPTTPGYEEFDLYPTPNNAGDVAKAKQLLAEAGHPNGFTLKMDVRALPKWQAQAEAVQDSLKQVGITVELNVIESSTYYQTIGTPAKQNDIAITGWCSPWQNGEPLLAPLFDGARIYPTGNYNLAQLNDPAINKRFIDIAKMPDADAQNAEYAKLNREIMALAPVVPLVRDTPLQIAGPNIGDAYSHAGVTGYIDYSSIGLIDPAKQ